MTTVINLRFDWTGADGYRPFAIFPSPVDALIVCHFDYWEEFLDVVSENFNLDRERLDSDLSYRTIRTDEETYAMFLLSLDFG